MDISAGDAGLTGREPPVHFDQEFSLPFCFIGKHGYEHSPSAIRNGLAEPECPLHGGHVQVLDGNEIVSIRQGTGKLMKDVFPLMLGFRIQHCNLHALFLVPFGTRLFPGQFPLRSGKLRFHGPVKGWKCRGVAVTVHLQARHGVIQSDA